MFDAEFKGYALNEKKELDTVSAPVLNYEKLLNLFQSKDFESNEIKEFEQLVKENGSMYFDKTCEVPPICFASIMRCGNTFYRRLIENISGVVTGSNIRITTTLCLAFVATGFKGESIMDNRSWVIKSHFPYVYPTASPCSISRAIVLVRNPLDVIVSLF